jgi:hypothetical protein
VLIVEIKKRVRCYGRKILKRNWAQISIILKWILEKSGKVVVQIQVPQLNTEYVVKRVIKCSSFREHVFVR